MADRRTIIRRSFRRYQKVDHKSKTRVLDHVMEQTNYRSRAYLALVLRLWAGSTGRSDRGDRCALWQEHPQPAPRRRSTKRKCVGRWSICGTNRHIISKRKPPGSLNNPGAIKPYKIPAITDGYTRFGDERFDDALPTTADFSAGLTSAAGWCRGRCIPRGSHWVCRAPRNRRTRTKAHAGPDDA